MDRRSAPFAHRAPRRFTAAARILERLSAAPAGLSDAELAAALAPLTRIHVNTECRRWARRGLIERRRVGGVIRNFAVEHRPAKH
jgi:hypothetical protein